MNQTNTVQPPKNHRKTTENEPQIIDLRPVKRGGAIEWHPVEQLEESNSVTIGGMVIVAGKETAQHLGVLSWQVAKMSVFASLHILYIGLAACTWVLSGLSCIVRAIVQDSIVDHPKYSRYKKSGQLGHRNYPESVQNNINITQNFH